MITNKEFKITDVLLPMEDEVLFSWVIRMLKHYSAGQLHNYSGRIMKCLFNSGTSRFPGLYYQTGLEYFLKNCGLNNSEIFSSEIQMINELTVFPFYKSFLDKDYCAKLLLDVEQKKSTNFRQSVFRFMRHKDYRSDYNHIKFCPQCINECEVIYLKREHQIVGNMSCFKHGCPLCYTPYDKNWKNVDFEKIIKDGDFKQYILSEKELETARKLAEMIHEIFLYGMKEDLSSIKSKLWYRMFDLGHISEEGKFYHYKELCDALGLYFLFDNDFVYKSVVRIIAESSFKPEPIILLVLIYRFFGGLNEIYSYAPNDKLKTKFISAPDIYLKYYDKKIYENKHSISYYAQCMEDSFFSEYRILGDTDSHIVIEHLACNQKYRSHKRKKRLDLCPYCIEKSNKYKKCMEKEIEYTRYVTLLRYCELHGKKELQIRNYIKAGRIENVIQIGARAYLIPIDSPYPKDLRCKQNQQS